jgi:hypothetical protein
MKAKIRTGAGLILKVSYDVVGDERTVGITTGINFNVIQGQKSIFTVDSPFPQEIAQGASPSMVTGSISVYLLNASDPLREGLVTPTYNLLAGDKPLQQSSRSMILRLYDRYTGDLAFCIKGVKVGSWNTAIQARGMVMANMSFEGTHFESGIG